MHVFFDSAAFAKRYIQEAGTDTVLEWCERATVLSLTLIALPELISAFCRLRREGVLNETQYQEVKSAMTLDLEDASLCELTPAVLTKTVWHLEQNVPRGMDAIHIASALTMKAEIFMTSDRRQSEAATRAGLRVVFV